MDRTMIEVPMVTNVTSANTNRDDGSICPLKLPSQSDKTGLAGAGAMKSSLTNLLKLYQEFLITYSAGQRNEEGETHLLSHVSELFRPRVPIENADEIDHGYARGWINTVLPHRLGTISMKTIFMEEAEMPVIGIETPGVRVIHHHGSSLGNLVAAYLVPDTETAIVVLSNTFGCSDVADWVGQSVLQTILGEKHHDYVEWISKTKSSLLQKYSDTIADLKKGRTDTPPSLNLSAYCGRYVNDLENFVLDVSLLSGEQGLQIRVQEFDDVIYDLFPYDGDAFYGPCDREIEMCDEIMFPWTRTGSREVVFCPESGKVSRLEWELDQSVGMEVFMKRDM